VLITSGVFRIEQRGYCHISVGYRSLPFLNHGPRCPSNLSINHYFLFRRFRLCQTSTNMNASRRGPKTYFRRLVTQHNGHDSAQVRTQLSTLFSQKFGDDPLKSLWMAAGRHGGSFAWARQCCYRRNRLGQDYTFHVTIDVATKWAIAHHLTTESASE